MMTYQEFEKDTHVYDIGERAQSFYVVLNGAVGEEVKNPSVGHWDWA